MLFSIDGILKGVGGAEEGTEDGPEDDGASLDDE